MYCVIDFCCICFNNKEHLQHLSASDVDNITYIIKLTSCVPEMCFDEMNDENLVCRTCCEAMGAAYKFRQECLRSKTMLTDYISQRQQVSNISGAVHVYLSDINKFCDINKEYSIENNGNKTKKIKLCENVDKRTNENLEISEVNSEHNPISLKLTDNRPNEMQFENVVVKMECENTNFDERIEENSVKNQEMIINISNIGVNFMAPEIKKENEDQDEYIQTNFNNILEMNGSENVGIGSEIEENHEYSLDFKIYSDESMLNIDDIKIDIDDNDVGLMYDGKSSNIRKSEDKCSKDDKVLPFKVEDEDTTDKDAFSCIETKRQNTSSDEISELQVCGSSNGRTKIDIDEETYKCNMCEQTFNHLSSINRHMRTHTYGNLHECNVCKKTFNLTSNLTQHMRTHTLEKLHECNICKKTFTRSNSLIQHLRMHEALKPYECDVCKKVFSQSSHLTYHMGTHTLENSFECSICKKMFSQSSYLTQHLKTHTLKKSHECKICKKTFSQSSNLTQHLRTHTLEKPYECYICKKTFSQSSHLTYHMGTHSVEKPFECSVCKKTFSQSGHLTKHMRTHTVEKPLKSNIYPKTFNQSSNSTPDLIDNLEKPFECNVCKKTFSQSSHLTYHMGTHTLEKLFECSICKLTFSHSGHLTQHLRTHTQENPHECNICKKTFSRSNNLSQHLRTHTSKKLFECNVCKKSFSRSHHLTYHMGTHIEKTV